MNIQYKEIHEYKVHLRDGSEIIAYSRRGRGKFCNMIRVILSSGDIALCFHRSPNSASRNDEDNATDVGIEFFGTIEDILYVEHTRVINVLV